MTGGQHVNTSPAAASGFCRQSVVFDHPLFAPPNTAAYTGLALFLAQTGALLHSSGHAGDPQNHSGLHSQLCDACLSFSTIFSMAGGPGTMSVLPPAVIAFLVVSASVSLVERRTTRLRPRTPRQ
jgi:hypothetical protein